MEYKLTIKTTENIIYKNINVTSVYEVKNIISNIGKNGYLDENDKYIFLIPPNKINEITATLIT